VADAVAVDTWVADGVRLGDVVGALSVLRDQSTTRRSSARTAVMTLIAVAPSDDQAYAATNALRSLGGHHPARIVILRPDADEVASLGARATLYAVEMQGHQINFEEVTLAVRGQAAHHLDSVVEAFTLSDLPVAVWYVSSVPDPTDPLLAVATAVLLDSRDAADMGQLRGLLELARRRTIVDLSWIRLAPWRELLAGLFDPPAAREWLDHVQAVEVSGKVGPRKLLGGWLAAQLGLAPRQVTLTDSRHVEIRVTCARGAEQAVFDVQRGDQRRTVSAQVSLPRGKTRTLSYGLADDPLPTALATALTRLKPDATWERALAAATTLAQ
jgi:glucose-6-phosphate dehydrogenase assembly protein OpcA